jgi:hypothetical protein
MYQVVGTASTLWREALFTQSLALSALIIAGIAALLVWRAVDRRLESA